MLAFIFVVILVILVLLFLTPIGINITYERTNLEDQLLVVISIWFFITLRFKFSFSNRSSKHNRHNEKQEKQQSGAKTGMLMKYVPLLLEGLPEIKRVIQQFMRHIRCRDLQWQTKIGVGDAAGTGTLIGMIWGSKSLIVSVLAHYLRLIGIPRFDVQPVWNSNYLRTRFHCILTFQLGHAMIAGVRILYWLRKGREQQWQTTPSRV